MAPVKSSSQLAQEAIYDLMKSATSAAVAIGEIKQQQTHLGANVENVSSTVKMGHDAIIVAIRESKEDLEAQIKELGLNHKKLEARQDGIDRKVMFFSGGATVIGTVLGYFSNKIILLFSGGHS